MLYYLLLLLVSLLHTTSSTVYYVIPDDHYTTNNNTYTLQHYLNNTNKYFTSHTQLHFLPGQYYLNTDLIIQHVSNLSLIGNRTNEVINSVIKCTSPAGIVVVGSSNIVIANIVMKECGNKNSYFTKGHPFVWRYPTSLSVIDCKFITVVYFHSIRFPRTSGIRLLNTLGSFTNIIATYMLIWYNDSLTTDRIANTIQVSKCQLQSKIYNEITKNHALEIKRDNSSANIKITLEHFNFTSKLAILNICNGCSGHSIVTISHCHFTNKYDHKHKKLYDEMLNYYQYSYSFENQSYSYDYEDDDIDDYEDYYIDDYELNYNGIIDDVYKYHYGYHPYKVMVVSIYKSCKNHEKPSRLQLLGCHFENISRLDEIVSFDIYMDTNDTTNTEQSLLVSIEECLFYNISATAISAGYYNPMLKIYHETILLKNTKISSIVKQNKHQIIWHTIFVDSMTLLLEEVIIHSIVLQYPIIAAQNCHLKFRMYNEISLNTALAAIETTSLYISENSILNFTANNVRYIIQDPDYNNENIYPCVIQYTSERGNLDDDFQMGQNLNYSVIFSNNNSKKVTNSNLMHCSWEKDAAFLTSSSLAVNQKYIHHDSSIKNNKTICLCKYQTCKCCHEVLGPFYPGQKVHLSLILMLTTASHKSVSLQTYDDSEFACKTRTPLPTDSFQLNTQGCKNVTYIINHKSGKWCELGLIADQKMEMFTVSLQPCPKGFLLHPQGYCQCDPILSSHIPSLTTCDIDHQTIPRPANTWISAHTINNSHSYHVSLHCPFDYCLPLSSQLNLSTPDSQCQFNRSGVLCGQCQYGLSAVFSSSQCKHCSNIYLLIIIPIGIAGIVIVLLLFTLNITVTNGDINPFLLYINIVSINAPIFFPTGESVMYTFVSLANLDLGIETCFYIGMNDYAKMWLQLMFPIYLIFIATVLIITSRYSTTIQRLTARRALPVLATLFLLSYTKVLLTVSNVLFSYTSITHLPSNHTTLVWSVDTSVPLFGVKFTILFIACLFLFLIFIPFNVVLIFTKKLSYFKVVTYFKPLLDAYQGPYKIKFYYWTGLQLLMRTIFFGLSALNRNINLMISSILLGVIIWLHEKCSSYKHKINNIMEALSLLNLHMLLVVSLYTTLNKIAVNISVSLAMFHLLCIILLHVKELLSNTLFKNTTFSLYSFTKLFNIFGHKVEPDQRHTLELINPIPEAANYKELQESLIGYDN